MKKNKYILLLIASTFIFLFQVYEALPIFFKNNGAVITMRGKSYMNTYNLSFKNENNALLFIHDSASFSVYHDIQNNSGVIYLYRLGYIFTDSNFVNADQVFIYDTSSVIVWKNVINSGSINNFSLIEIGTCP